MLDTSTLAAAGFAPGNFTPEYQQRAYQAFVDEVNARGGINGRKLTAVYAKSDPLQADTAIAACESVVVDHGAFAVFTFAGFPTQAMLCVTEQHKTPLIAFNGYVPDEFFQRAQGRLVVEGMRGSRVMYNWVHELHALGLLKQKKIGVLYSDETAGGDRQNTEKALLPALAEYGYEVTHRTKLAAGIHTAAGQIPVEVSQMRQSGVDTVLIATNCVLAPQWVQQAESQGWRPQYVVGDHQGMSISEQCVGSMPTSFDGAVGVTAYSYPGGGAAREGIPEPDVDRRCREIYNRASGEGVKWGDAHPYKAACGQVLMFERALAAAGTNPTRTQWASELRSLGTFALPIVLGGGFNDRTDFADMIKTVRADKGCDCYRTTSAARRARF